MKPLSIGVIMDPLSQLSHETDSTLALIEEALHRQHEVVAIPFESLSYVHESIWAETHLLTFNAQRQIQQNLEPKKRRLVSLDILLMRKDPPFDLNYLYSTYLLEQAEKSGVWVINRPRSLRDHNEKFFTTAFPQCIPPTIVTCSLKTLHEFIKEMEIAIVKCLDSLAGRSVFRVDHNDPNLNALLELLTERGKKWIMAQRFLPEIKSGDKRIILIDGNPIPYALARIPAHDDFRGNLAQGATAIGMPLTERDHWICDQIGPSLREQGLYFVGIDVIGDYLTEINVTSPTGIRQLNRLFDLNIAGEFWNFVESRM